MADEILDFLRERFNRLDARLDDMQRTLRELGQRMTLLESSVAQVISAQAALSMRIDHVTDRLDRIERRLDLAEAR